MDVDDLDINSDTKFRSAKLSIANPANTFSYLFVGSAIGANRNITIPLLTTNDTLTLNDMVATLKNKTLDSTNSYTGVITSSAGNGVAIALPNIDTSLGTTKNLLVTQTITDTATTAADYYPVQMDFTYLANDVTSEFDLASAGLHATTIYGSGGIDAKGTIQTGTFNVNILGSTHVNNETGNIMGWCRNVTEPASMWFLDANMHGPTVQPGLFTGLNIFMNNHYNGSPSRNTSNGVGIYTQYGQGGGADPSQDTMQTYPIDLGLIITGTSGTVSNGAANGFNTGIQVGGGGGSWGMAGAKIGTGVRLLNCVDHCIDTSSQGALTGYILKLPSQGYIGVTGNSKLGFDGTVFDMLCTGVSARSTATGNWGAEIGSNHATGGDCFIDMHTDSGDGDYRARIIRNLGTNATFMIDSTGSGNIELKSGGKLACGGTNLRVQIDETGLTAARAFTFPDIAGRVSIISDRNYYEQQDEFSCGSITNTNTSNQVGVLNWGFTTSGTSAPVVTAGVASHPGIVSLVTGATSTNNSRLHLTDAAATAFCDPTDLDRVMFIIRIPTITTMSVRVGVGQDISSTTFGTAGAWFSFDSAVNAAWQTITRQASTSTTNTSGVTVTANNWYMLELVRLSGGNWEFYINNALAFTHSANQPTTACNIGMMVQTGTSAGRNLDIDYFHIRTKKLGQRWT